MEVTTVERKIIEVTPEAWHALRVYSAQHDINQWELASRALLDYLKRREASDKSRAPGRVADR